MSENTAPNAIAVLGDAARVTSIILEHERIDITRIESDEPETMSGGWTGGVVLTDGRILEDHDASLYGVICKLAAQVSESP